MDFEHFSNLQYMMSSTGSKYEIPEEVNENLLMSLGKNVEMKTFKTNVVPEEQAAMADEENKLVVILCVGTITGKNDAFLKDHFCRSPPKGSRVPTICMDIHLKKITSSLESEERPSSVVNEIDPDHYEGFHFTSSHGALIFWTPEQSSSLSEAAKWRKAITEFANSQIPCVLVTFNSTNLEWLGKGKTFESEEALKQFCRDQGFDTWFEMRSPDWDGAMFEAGVAYLMGKIQTGETS